MSNFFHLTLLVVALALLISSSCIQLAPAFSLPPCSGLNSSWISEKAPINDDNTRNLTLFKLSFLTNQSISFTFTTTFSQFEDGAPGLVFFRLLLQEEPTSSPCMREQYTFSQPLPRHVCNPLPQQTPTAITCFTQPAYPYDSNNAPFKDEVLLAYDAVTTAFHLQERFYTDGVLNQTVTNDWQLYGINSSVSNDSLTLFVAYITSWEGSNIDVTNSTNVTSTGVPTMNSSAPPPFTTNLIYPDKFVVLDGDNNAKSNHTKLVVLVIVGVMMALGLLILVLFIAKRHRRRPSLVSSRLASGSLGASPPSTTSKVPFSHQDLESSTTPMMKALPFSPPHNSAFQISGTASWLKQPMNPR